MIKNQKRIILIGAIVLVALIPIYFFVIAPLLKTEQNVEEPPELLPGEVLGTSNRILMFEQVERAAIQSILVNNQYGEYKFYLDDDGNYYIKGMKGAPYNLELFSSLVVSAGNTLTLQRITTDCEDLSVYGLAESDNPAWYELTKTDGTVHKVYIGKETPSDGAYYARYEGRNAVYTLDASIKSTLLSGIYSMITPILSYQLTEKNYYMADDFFLIRNGEPVVWIDFISEEETPTSGGMGTWKMTFPASYTVNESSYSSLLEVFTEFMGSETVEFGSALTDQFFNDSYISDDDPKIDEDMQKYMEHLETTYGIRTGTGEAAYMFHYSIEGIHNYVFFSEPDLEGNMYAYSSLYDLVAKINLSDCAFLEWEIIKFVDRPIFLQNISTVSRIDIESDELNCSFFINGDENIKVHTSASTKPFGEAMYRSFQEWYREFVGLYIQDKTDSTATDHLLMTITVTNDAGEVTIYRFYPYSTRRCFFTIDDPNDDQPPSGEFYLLNEKVERLLTDAGRLMRGEIVDADAIY